MVYKFDEAKLKLKLKQGILI